VWCVWRFVCSHFTATSSASLYLTNLRDLPSEIRATLQSLVAGIPNGDTAINNGFVEHGLAIIAEVGKKVELEFWQWFEARIETSSG
jgi:hypothetical protein